MWIPGHRRVSGHDTADELAREGRIKDSIDRSPLHDHKVLIQHLKARTKQLFEIEWNNRSTKSKQYAPLLPVNPNFNIHHKHNNISYQFSKWLTRIRSNILGLNEYLHKINKSPSPLCQCKKEHETILHFLFKCHIWNDARNKILAPIQPNETFTMKDLDDLLNSQKTMVLILEFIRESGRFNFKPSATKKQSSPIERLETTTATTTTITTTT